MRIHIKARGTPEQVKQHVIDQLQAAHATYPDSALLIDTVGDQALGFVAATPQSMAVSVDVEVTDRSGYSVAVGREDGE